MLTLNGLALAAGGGAIGAAARYGVGAWALHALGPRAWPVGTFAVNLAGGLAMGLLVGWLAHASTVVMGLQPRDLRVFLGVGVLGGFTTFSAFSLELFELVERRDWVLAAGYALASVAGACAALALGLWIMRRILA